MSTNLTFSETVDHLDRTGELPHFDYARRRAFIDSIASVDEVEALKDRIAELEEQLIE